MRRWKVLVIAGVTTLVTPNVSWVGSLLGEPFVWFPPVLAPLAFSLVAVLGASALFEEVPEGIVLDPGMTRCPGGGNKAKWANIRGYRRRAP